MITFHKLTQLQYEKMLALSGQVTDGLYFLTDVGVIKLHNGGESVTTFGTSVKTVSVFPDANNAQMYCIYCNEDTKEQRMWDGSNWQILSYPITNLITSGLAASGAITTVPNTAAVYNFVKDRVAAALLGVQVRLHPPVHTSGQLIDLPLSTADGTKLIEDKCMILVLTQGLYRYDAQSVDVDDPNTDAVITPQDIIDGMPEGGNINIYPGRWIKMFDNIGYVASSGVIITGNNNDVNQIIALNVNTEQFTFIDGALNINPDADFVGQKVDKVVGKGDQIPIWRTDGNQDASGFKFNSAQGAKLTNLSTSISPDSVISTFVHEITDKKLDDVKADSDGKIIVGKGNDGKVDASLYDIGTDNDNLHGHIQLIPQNRVATEKAVKWYIDRSLSFNKDQNLAETVDGIPPTELGD